MVLTLIQLVRVQACLELIVDMYTLLGMVAIEPMIAAMDLLMSYAQARHVYIHDYIRALVICDATILKLYANPVCAFSTDAHHVFKSLMGFNHYNIHIKRDVGDMNKGAGEKYLVFNVRGKLESTIHKGQHVDETTFHGLAAQVKNEFSVG